MDNKFKYMTCTTCRRVVQLNNVGICLGCQKGFNPLPQEDALEHEEPSKEEEIKSLTERKLELEEALGQQKKEEDKSKNTNEMEVRDKKHKKSKRK